MKILLTTLHSQNNNFGSVLQAYALYTYLEKQGYEVEILDYRPFYSNGITGIRRFFTKIAANMLFLIPYLIRSRRFETFISAQKLTRRYSSYRELERKPPVADVFLIGSDQVWNTEYRCGNDNAYYLKFVHSPNKLSYAASLGRKVEKTEELVKLKNRLSDFKAVSLREEVSALQLQKIGMTQARYVLDPVFLLDREHYRQLERRVNAENYILAYVIQKDPFMEKVITMLAARLNKKVIQIGGFAKKCQADEIVRTAGPAEFLAYVAQADFVITSSFHGTAFSLIYQKQFAVVMPPTNRLRVENILNSAGLLKRVIHTPDDLAIVDQVIDYSKVQPNLNRLREISKHFLNDALSGCCVSK